ncbi:hypothetical protein NL676_008147 [Syzygium grande]|nr:hypothetical protein NL676_008147 [Syzygium grande]
MHRAGRRRLESINGRAGPTAAPPIRKSCKQEPCEPDGPHSGPTAQRLNRPPPPALYTLVRAPQAPKRASRKAEPALEALRAEVTSTPPPPPGPTRFHRLQPVAGSPHALRFHPRAPRAGPTEQPIRHGDFAPLKKSIGLNRSRTGIRNARTPRDKHAA